MGSQAGPDPTHAVDGLVRAIRDLTSDPNYKLVADVFSEFLFLKDHNHRLSMSHRETMEEYRKFRNDLEDTKAKIEKEKAELEGVVHEKAKEIMQLSAARASLEGDLEDTHAMLEQQKMVAFEAHQAAARELAEAQAAREAALAELQRSKEEELAALQRSKERELAALQKSKEQELAALQTSKSDELASLQLSKSGELAALQQSKAEELAALQTAKELAIVDLTNRKDGEIAELTAIKNNEIADLEAAKSILEKEMHLAGEIAAAAAAKAAADIATLEDTKKTLEQTKADNEAEISGLKDNVASLEDAKAALEKIKADYEAETATLKDRVATLEKEKSDVEESLAAANAEIMSLRDTVAQKSTEIEGLQETLRIAEEQIASLQSTVEERNAEIDNLHGKLKQEGERAELAIATGDDLQARLDDTESALQDTENRLADLEQYRVVLSDDNEDVYVTVLDKIWTNIVTLVESTFRPDIDEAILSDPSCWTNLRSSPYLKHATQLQIPLPQTNSPAAKGMRISAVLAVLSRALHRHLFRPAYLPLDDTDEANPMSETALIKFLRLLEDEDPAREAHMRATLLAMLPEQQAEQGQRRVQTVVREVSWLVQHLLSAVQFAEFVAGLEAACKLAREQWGRIQNAVIKIEPYFGPPYDDFDWQVLELPEFGIGGGGSEYGMGGGASSDGMGSLHEGEEGGEVMPEGLEAVEEGRGEEGTADEVEAARNGGQSPAMMEGGGVSIQGGDEGYGDVEGTVDDGDIEPEEILLVVWPSMCSVEGGDLVSITQGLVISKEQARPALEEVRSRARMIARPGSRRARTLSMPVQSRTNSPGPSRLKMPVFGGAQLQTVSSEGQTEVAGPEDG